MPANSEKQHLSIVICGHVDSGKSTTTGRLIFELGGLPERELEKLKQEAERLGKGSFAFAFFMDRQKEERERGVTISCTTKEFFTEKWHYTSGRVIPSWFIPTSGAAGLDTGQRCQGTKYRTSPQMSASYMRYLILLLAAQTIAADARVIDEFEGEPSMTSAGWLSIIFCTTFLLMLFGMLVGEAWSRFWYGMGDLFQGMESICANFVIRVGPGARMWESRALCIGVPSVPLRDVASSARYLQEFGVQASAGSAGELLFVPPLGAFFSSRLHSVLTEWPVLDGSGAGVSDTLRGVVGFCLSC